MHYFDHASTSFPKPPEVLEHIQTYLTHFGASPGRGSHFLAQKTEQWVEKTRTTLAQILSIPNSSHIAFTMNATQGLNMVIKGFIKPKSHILICRYSHNAVLRPLEKLAQEREVSYDVVPVDTEGRVDMEFIRTHMRNETVLFIATGASNVIGVKADFTEAFAYCKTKGVKILFDCTQSLGYERGIIDRSPIDFLVGTGHKTLLGPTGIGFVYVKDPDDLPSFLEGGSAGNASFSREHPVAPPYKWEAGTMNVVGIVGLLGSLEYISQKTFTTLDTQAMTLCEKIWQELSVYNNILLYGTSDMAKKIPVISFNIRGLISSQIAAELNEKHKICVRAGLHCAPLLHDFLRTAPTGTVRISIGHQNTEKDARTLLHAIQEISSG